MLPVPYILHDESNNHKCQLRGGASDEHVPDSRLLSHAGIKQLGSQPVLPESVPVLLVGGRLTLQHTNGSFETIILETHKPLEVAPPSTVTLFLPLTFPNICRT